MLVFKSLLLIMYVVGCFLIIEKFNGRDTFANVPMFLSNLFSIIIITLAVILAIAFPIEFFKVVDFSNVLGSDFGVGLIHKPYNLGANLIFYFSTLLTIVLSIIGYLRDNFNNRY